MGLNLCLEISIWTLINADYKDFQSCHKVTKTPSFFVALCLIGKEVVESLTNVSGAETKMLDVDERKAIARELIEIIKDSGVINQLDITPKNIRIGVFIQESY